MKLDIISDVNFEGYKHVNHYLYDMAKSNGVDVRYIGKMYMNLPDYSNIKSVALSAVNKFKNSNQSSHGPIHEESHLSHSCLSPLNLPPTNTILDTLNSLLLLPKFRPEHRIAITFVPSKSLDLLFGRYKVLSYYCVHDSLNQRYANFNIEYESKLVDKCRFVFCDNLDVIKRLSNGGGWIDVANESEIELSVLSKNKFFLVPPPVPDQFFDYNYQFHKVYDFCYFGSIHKNIDELWIEKLVISGARVNVISSERLSFSHSNLKYSEPIFDQTELVKQIDKSKAILLPYRNSEFMNTISPAKVFQSLSTKRPVFCSNQKILEKYGLYSSGDAFEFVNGKSFESKIEDLTKYSVKSQLGNLIKILELVK